MSTKIKTVYNMKTREMLKVIPLITLAPADVMFG